MATPVLFVVDDDRAALARVMAELQRRYDADYRIAGESSAAAAMQELQRLREEHQQVAVVLANLWLGDQTSIELLKQARHFHPNAQRILLVPDPLDPRRRHPG